MKIFISLLLIMEAMYGWSQSIERQLLGSAGLSIQATESGIDFTVGEPMIAFTSTPENVLSQGFLQPNIQEVISVFEIGIGELHLYPNPTRSRFNLQSTDLMHLLEMYDSEGRLVFIKKLQTNQVVIEPNMLAGGLYHLKITTSQKVITKKIQIL